MINILIDLGRVKSFFPLLLDLLFDYYSGEIV